MYSCTPGYNKSGRRGQLCCPSVWGPLVPRNNVTVSIWQLGTGSLLWGGAQQRRLTQGRGSRGEAPWQGSLPVQKRSLPDNLFPFICFNLSSDQAGSPLIISVIPLLNPRQQICFSKVSEPELDWKKKGGNPLLLKRLARALAGSSRQLCSLSSQGQNCTQQPMESFEREFG